jgi:DAACS family dicarboxylate/amino acid:cation (Na+ or H+) symporter
MLVIPLIISALIIGVTEFEDIKKMGRVGLKTLFFALIISSVAVIIGIVMVTAFKPGKSLTTNDRQHLIEQFAGNADQIKTNMEAGNERNAGDVIVTLIPKNPIEDMARAFDPSYRGGGILAIMFFSLFIGTVMLYTDPEKTKGFKSTIEGLYEITMKGIGIAMKLAPFGVFALLFNLSATLGISILVVLLKFVFVVLASLIIHQFVTYSLILKFIGKMNPGYFFKQISEVMLTAFSTSSSNATLPTAIRVSIDNLKLPRDITHFVLTVGSSANQNGTALYEGITVLFLAQVFGIELSLGQQILVVLLSILAGIGTAGIPGGSLPVIMTILVSVGIPAGAIAIIYGVDRILDMCRTVLNVTGDITTAVVIAKHEKG